MSMINIILSLTVLQQKALQHSSEQNPKLIWKDIIYTVNAVQHGSASTAEGVRANAFSLAATVTISSLKKEPWIMLDEIVFSLFGKHFL